MTNEDVKVLLVRKIEALRGEILLKLQQLADEIVWAINTSTVSTEFDNTKRNDSAKPSTPLEKKDIPPPRKPNGYKSAEEQHQEAVTQLDNTINAMFNKDLIPDSIPIKNFNTDGFNFEITLIDPSQNIQAIFTVGQEEYEALLEQGTTHINYLSREEINDLEWIPILADPVEETVNG